MLKMCVDRYVKKYYILYHNAREPTWPKSQPAQSKWHVTLQQIKYDWLSVSGRFTYFPFLDVGNNLQAYQICIFFYKRGWGGLYLIRTEGKLHVQSGYSCFNHKNVITERNIISLVQWFTNCILWMCVSGHGARDRRVEVVKLGIISLLHHHSKTAVTLILGFCTR